MHGPGIRGNRIASWLGVAAMVAILFAGKSAARAQSPPFQLGPPAQPGQFEVTTFASGLNGPLSMQELSDGSILVGSLSGVLRLVDADGDGAADGPGQVLSPDPPGPFITSVRTSGDLLFVNVPGSIRAYRLGAAPSDPLTSLGSIRFTYPSGWGHTNVALVAQDLGGGQHDLYFNVGSQFNNANSTGHPSLSGLATGSLNGESLYRIRVTESGGSLVTSDLTQIATGLRNASGLAFHPTTGDLYLSDNGINHPSNPADQLSADELNVITAANLGGPIEDFGYADRYVEYRTGQHVGTGGIDPLVAFQPTTNPPTGNPAESEGAVEIAFAPELFPSAFRNGVFVGFHGEGESGLTNGENPLVFVDLTTGSYTHFIPTNQAGIVHPDGLLATRDSLYVADLGNLGQPNSGAIYRIRAVPEPTSLALLTLGGLATYAMTRRRASHRRVNSASGTIPAASER
jgi:glucose/arabinose dehydrogenase